jgi:microcystin-dependent protein
MTPFIGQLMAVAFGFPPKGWTFCTGQLLSISQNQALFALLGTAFGGNGQTTFALPDLRGRAAVGIGQGSGLQNYTMGEVAGAESVTLTIATLPFHGHNFQASATDPTLGSPDGAVLGKFAMYANQGSESMPAISTAGANQPHENRQPYLAVNWCIALTGIFPSRN